MKHKLSQWHSADTKPVHVGFYEIALFDNGGNAHVNGSMFSFWDGLVWRGWEYKIKIKYCSYQVQTDFIIHGQNRQWRGIVKGKK